MLVCSIDHNLVSSRHSKHHPVWQLEKRSLFAVALRLMVEVWVELDAGGISFQTWKHEGWLTQSMLQESVNCVGVAAAGLCRILEVVEAGRWGQK